MADSPLFPISDAFPDAATPDAAQKVLPAEPPFDQRVAETQIALERVDFSCGCIDNETGPHTSRAIAAFQRSRGLLETGVVDDSTRALLPMGDLFTTYLITPEDVQAVMIQPPTIREKSQAKYLGYYSLDEFLAEKFHVTRAFLHLLNQHVPLEAGVYIRVPNLPSTHPKLKAASVRIALADQSVEARDAAGRTLAYFPCSIAADKQKRPSGELKVANYAPNPDYTFDPKLFPEISAKEGLTKKLVLPPGPNNPVGLVWIGLSLPTYGMHGTPDPENIGHTFSHGCFRLTNWNALRLYHLIEIGTPVIIDP